MIDVLPQTPIRIEDTLTGIRIYSQFKRNALTLAHGIIGTVFIFPFLACVIPIELLLLGDYQEKNLPAILFFPALTVICLFGFIRCVKEIRDNLAVSETIEVDETGVKIERRGFFTARHTIPAGRIRGITSAPTFPTGGGLLGFLKNGSRNGSIWIWSTTRLKLPEMVGSGLSNTDAILFLGRVWARYPQYKFNRTGNHPDTP